MAKEKQKPRYQGFKLGADSADNRRQAQLRLEKALRNSAGKEEMSNEAFAASDGEFRRHCEIAGVQPTRRQASKYRNRYGAAARAGNRNDRRAPAGA